MRDFIVFKVLRRPWLYHHAHCVVEDHTKNCVNADNQVKKCLGLTFLKSRECVNVEVRERDQEKVKQTDECILAVFAYLLKYVGKDLYSAVY